MHHPVLRYTAAFTLAQLFGLLVCCVLSLSAAMLTYPASETDRVLSQLSNITRFGFSVGIDRATIGRNPTAVADTQAKVSFAIKQLDFIGHLQWLINNAWYLFAVPTTVALIAVYKKEQPVGRDLIRIPDWLTSDTTSNMTATVAAAIMFGVGIRATLDLGPAFLFGTAGILWLAAFAYVGIFPITLLLLGVLFATKGSAPAKMERKFLLCAVPLLMPILTLMWGAYCWQFCEGNHGSSGWPINVLQILLAIYVFSSMALCVIYRGNRQFFAAVFVNGLWFFLLCNFISGMAITGVWL